MEGHQGRRFIDDFTRQWLQRDKVDDFEPDMRVYKNVRRGVDSWVAKAANSFAIYSKRT